MTDGHRQFHATQSLFSVNLAQSHFNGALSHIYTATYRLLMQHSCVSMQHSRSSMQHSRICMQHSRISMQHSRISMQHSGISVQHSRISVQHRPFLCSRGGPYRPPYILLNGVVIFTDLKRHLMLLITPFLYANCKCTVLIKTVSNSLNPI